MPKFSRKKLAMIALLLDEEEEGKEKIKENVGDRNDQRGEGCR